MTQEFKTRTGAIYCDTEKKMEYLYVGDYGKENNIKADFLGYKKEINQVSHHEVNLRDKMVVTISTQKGCPMNCMFCDCPKVKFGGNISREELAEEVVNAIKFSGCKYTERFNLHLARMGEPSLNAANVLNFLKYDLQDIVNANMKADVIHPVFTTMMPKSLGVWKLEPILKAFCDIKNNVYNGEAGLQLSINSTDEKQRKELFRGCSMSLEDILKILITNTCNMELKDYTTEELKAELKRRVELAKAQNNDRIICDITKQDEWEIYEPVRQESAEWSEKDETYLDHVFTAVKAYYTDDKGHENPWREELLIWLKSLKERYTWKPSDEQILALRWILNNIPYDRHKEEISGLLEQIKKLREE